ncbi:serine/threonine-protein kinase [Micromonospora sp. WMMD712]|uniref:serine/threonine-protein kinase n=1 Tax=Micromonospora sp. WMMD712 TaxID=3016096 RepID=UPI00249B37D4|nr:serine/threonine-protein kinase [Micromonospora sp. WMMD712]WFE57073.1 serine/threonine-protein kinase [Micromonospora sp. WMMD712]
MPETTPLGPRDPGRAGPYELLGRLGSGGQGVVYLGRDRQGRLVAVKMLDLSAPPDPRARARFAKEIDAARRVAPFCTAQILFADVDDDPPYVVSEYIEGPTLHRHVQERGPLAGNVLHRLAVGTATALAAIHQAGVVHCDLKPDNVVLGADGPRVIDFGIARALDVTATVTGRIMGTAAYLAPERFRDDGVGPASDVFAWAATIAYAATGRPPFGTGAVAAVLHRVLHDPPDLAGFSGPLAELVAECLAKDHRARPPADQVLLRLLGHGGAPVPLRAALQQGTDAAATQPVPRQPTPPAPAAWQPPPTAAWQPAQQPDGPAAYEPTAYEPTAYEPTAYEPTAYGQTTHEPTAAAYGPAVAYGARPERWARRLRRESTDAWGVSTAIFLGAVGGAVAYVASTAVGTAAAVGAVTFVVVYGVRLLVATALPPAAAPPGEGGGAPPQPPSDPYPWRSP